MVTSSIKLKRPRRRCDDVNCPFHGRLSVRGRVIEGIVASDKMDKSAIVLRDYLHYVRKYMRYERRHSRIPAHNPPCLDAKVGDRVRIMECRPLSKTISFVIVEKLESAAGGG